MCWNEKVSLLTFIVGTIFCIIGYYKTTINLHKLFYLFFQCVIFVQLGEAMIWYDKNCGTIGRIGTMIAFFGVWLQPIIGMYIVNILEPDHNIFYKTLLLFYILFSLKTIYKIFMNNKCYQPICENSSKPHLSFTEWNNFNPMGIIYGICILYLIFIFYKESKVISIYIFITMILSTIFYKNTFGSMWCWFSAFSPILAIIYL